MFDWALGRQGGGYSKIKLLESKKFRFDLYILKIPAFTKIPKHKDPSQGGFKHHRINWTISGPSKRMYVLGRVRRWAGFEYFRPDIYEHGLEPVWEDIYMISFGWLTKTA